MSETIFEHTQALSGLRGREYGIYGERVVVLIMKYFSMFSGVEGFGQGIDGEPIGFSEIDKYASMVLKYGFP